MKIEDTLTAASKALSDHNIAFALIGGFALAAHGVVRATVDIDLLIDGNKRTEAEASLLAAGFSLVAKNEEVMHLSGIGQLDVLFANREATQSMLGRAKRIMEFPVPVVSAEDLIGLKIQAYKNDSKREFQDKADIQKIIEVNKGLDFKLVKEYADLFDEWQFIERLRSEK